MIMTNEPEIAPQMLKLWPQNKSPYDEKGQCAHPGCTRIFAKDKTGKPYTNRVNEHYVRKHNFEPPLARRKYKDPEVVEAKQEMKKLRGNYKAKLKRYTSKGVMRDLNAAILGTKREIETLKKLEKPVAKAKTILDLDVLMNNSEEVPSLPLLCLCFHSTIIKWGEEKAFLEGKEKPDPILLPTPANIEIYARRIMYFCHPSSWSEAVYHKALKENCVSYYGILDRALTLYLSLSEAQKKQSWMCDTNTFTVFEAAQQKYKASAKAWMNTQREIARLEQLVVDMDDPVKIQEWISNAIDIWKNDNPPPEAHCI